MEEISATKLAVSETSTSKGGKTRQRRPSCFLEEWVKLFLGSTNANSTDDLVFFDPYAKCLDTNGAELFYYFYCNREEKIPICNPWKKNLAKLIFPEVFMDVDLMKALFQCYNLITKSFHRRDVTILCTLDRESFIEAFGLTGAMGQPLDLKDLKRRFEAHPTTFTRNSLLQHIPGEFKRVGDYPKKIKDKMPMDKFKNYFVKTINGFYKVVGKDGFDKSGELNI